MTSRCSVSRASSPMSATTTSPARKRPGATARPTLRPCIVTVTSARTAAPATSPVDASTPDGMSTATTGTPPPLICSMSAEVSSRGAPFIPVPSSASMMTSGRSSTISRPAREQQLAGDLPVAAVRAAAGMDRDPARVGKAAHELLRDRRSRALHHRVDVVARLGGAHLLGRVERLELSHRTRQPPPARARASASSRGRPQRRRAQRRAPRAARRAAPPASGARRSRSPSTRTHARRRSRAPCRPPPCRRSGPRSSPPDSGGSRSRRAPPR